MQNTLEEQLTQLVEPELVAKDFELFSVRIFRTGNRRVFSFAIDRATGGIKLEECVFLNRIIGDLVDASGLVTDEYTVEVASPGVDRPLSAEKDFRRLTGKRIWVQYRMPDQSAAETIGTLELVESGTIFLHDPRTATTAEVRLDTVLQAKPEILVKR